MPQALKPEKLRRYKDVVALLIKYGRSDLVKQAGLDSSAAERESIAVREQEPEADELASDLERLGPISEEATTILTQRIAKSIEPGNILSRVVEVKEFVERLPTRINRILDAVGNNELKIGVDAIDEKIVLDGLQKVANRIALGLVLAALIVGAALMMRVENLVSDSWLSRFADNLLHTGCNRRDRTRHEYRFLRCEAEKERRRRLAPF